MKPVAPLCAAKRVVLPPMPAGPKALLRQRREWAAGRNDTPLPTVSDHFSPAGPEQDPTRFTRAGCGPDLPRDLKRGKWPTQASLDLHGSTQEEDRKSTRLNSSH